MPHVQLCCVARNHRQNPITEWHIRGCTDRTVYGSVILERGAFILNVEGESPLQAGSLSSAQMMAEDMLAARTIN